jgi:Domain of unknown function (DUF932)
MAATLTREQMFAEIIRQDEAKLDLVSDTRRMNVTTEDGTATLHVDRDADVLSFDMNDHALSQVAGDLQIPKRYFDRMRIEAPTLFDSNVNYWLSNQPERKLVRGFKPGPTGGAGVGRAWLSDRYRRLDNVEIAKRIFPVFDEIEGLTFHQSQLTDTRFYLRAYLPSLEREVKAGDIIRAGVEIKNSEVGAGALVVQPYLLRLVCTNGMTVAEHGVRRNHVGRRIVDESYLSDEALEADDNALWLVARDTVKSVLNEVRFNEIIDQLAETITGEQIVAPVAATETLAQRFGFTEEEREEIVANLHREGDMSQWGMLNAVTAAAKTVESFDRQAEMEAMGWDIANLTTKEWASVAVVTP